MSTFAPTRRSLLGGAAMLVAAPTLLRAQARTLNLYSSRHYDTDEALYSDFTKQTGITINRVEAGEDPLLARMQSEGANSPADVLITVDAGRIEKAQSSACCSPSPPRRWRAASRPTCAIPTATGSASPPARASCWWPRTRWPRVPSAPMRISRTRSGRARCSSAPPPMSTTSRSPARSSPPMARRRPKPGHAGRRQPRPSAARRRQRPDPRRGGRRGRHRGVEHLLLRPPGGLLEAGGPRGGLQAPRRLPEPGPTAART